jgi:hypothetical protein
MTFGQDSLEGRMRFGGDLFAGPFEVRQIRDLVPD